MRASSKDYTAEGLRGLAALNVFFSHFFLTFFPLGFTNLFPGLQKSAAADGAMEHFLRLPFLSILWNGNFAVCVFFVLSGYVLSKPYYDGRRMDALRDRYLKRYFRLSIPIAASVFLGWALLTAGTLQHLKAAGISHSDWLTTYLVFPGTFWEAVKDALYRVIFLGEFRFNPPLWTMRVEFIGSLIIFAFYALMPEGRKRKILHYTIALVSLGLLTGSDAVYYYAFLAGAALWNGRAPRRLAWVLLACGWYLGAFQFDAWYNWLPVVSQAIPSWDVKAFYNVLGAIALFAALRSGVADKLLASSAGRTLGRLSFSLYLTHFFVICTFSSWFFVTFIGRWSRALVSSVDFVLSLALLLIVAWLFERLVDRPGIGLSQRIVMKTP